MGTRKHYAAAVSAFVVWGFFSLPLRALKDYTAGEILYFRIASSVVILLVILFGFRRYKMKMDLMRLRSFPEKQRNQIVGLILGGGVLLIVNWLIFIYVINAINIKTASFSYFICPVLTAVLGNFILREKLSQLQWLAVSLCIISCVLLGLNSAAELGYSFAVALSYALYLITQRRNNGFDRLSVLFVQMLFALLILSLAFPWLVNDVPQTFHFYGLIIVVAGVFTVLPLFLNLYALNGINSTTVGILLYINPLMNFIIAFLVFDETITSLQAIGYLIILVALVLFNYPNLQKMRVRLTNSANA
ncbi:MAG TPA: EamA family transporter [Cytophagales bacterium]|nr:EamA family transporter [Cytophagales bacterium]HRG10481.1 EamA family transporter [Cyclobacteriaceae bacterium]